MFRAGLSLGVSPSPAPGWDISSLNLAEAMRRAQVLDWGLQEQLWPHLEALRPRPSVYIPEFIAANQSVRADNLILGTRAQQVRPRPKPFIPCHLLLPDIAHHPNPRSHVTVHVSPRFHPAVPDLPRSRGLYNLLPSLPSWSRSVGTSVTSDPVLG